MAYSTERATTTIAKDAIAGTSQGNDEELCVDIYAFETDGDLDTSFDEVYAGWCFLGSCHYVKWVRFSGERAEWDEGWKCMKIQSALLASNRVYFEVWEEDIEWDDTYTERESKDLSDQPTTNSWKLTLTPTKESGGTYAYLWVKVKRTPLRLLSQDVVSASSTCGQSMHVGAGMHGGISGFQLPNTWGHGGTKLVDPISFPSYRSEMEQMMCEELPQGIFDRND